MRFNRMMECGQTRKIVIGAVAAAAGAAGAVAILKKSGLKQSASSATYRASSKSKTVHQSGCRYYNTKTLTEAFKSLKEAAGAGYHACKVGLP